MKGSVGATNLFWLIEISLLPVTLLGYLLLLFKAIPLSRRHGVSATAYTPLIVRWFLSQLGKRSDPAAGRLLFALPGTSRSGACLLLWPSLFAVRITGVEPELFRYPLNGPSGMLTHFNQRTTFFDQALARFLPVVDQIVILGAGWDTRLVNIHGEAGVKLFEVDVPQTQLIKRQALFKAGLDTDHITFVPVNFKQTSCFESLIRAGFDPDRPAFFLWEAVTIYLSAQMVADTLETIATRLAPGSAIAFDYFSSDIVGPGGPLLVKFTKMLMRFSGEPLTFGVNTYPPARERVATFVGNCGLGLQQFEPYGLETVQQTAYGGAVVAVVL